ncbi:MAG TPA: DsrE family protein [Geobacterales bacterium]|nr:DsrE family protein [Geobacterales bacterium]
MKVSIVLTRKLNKSIFVALSYAAYFARTNEVYLIFIDEAVELLVKGNEIPLEDRMKKISQAQTGVNLENVKTHIDFIRLLMKKFGTKVKICNTSTISRNISSRLGDSSNIEGNFELSTIFEIATLLSESDLTLNF